MIEEKTHRKRLLTKGAEADIYLARYFNMKAVVKIRIPKAYRVDQLDHHLRKTRTRKEAKLLLEAKKAGVPSPVVMAVWPDQYIIVQEYVAGTVLKKHLLESSQSIETKLSLIEQLGRLTAKLHKENIIHGDLTTSNVIVAHRNHSLILIDFGLGEFSSSIESKGEEIRVLIGSLLSVHYTNYNEYLSSFKRGYRQVASNSEKVIQRARKILNRGRYIS